MLLHKNAYLSCHQHPDQQMDNVELTDFRLQGNTEHKRNNKRKTNQMLDFKRLKI